MRLDGRIAIAVINGHKKRVTCSTTRKVSYFGVMYWKRGARDSALIPEPAKVEQNPNDVTKSAMTSATPTLRRPATHPRCCLSIRITFLNVGNGHMGRAIDICRMTTLG